MLEKLKAVNIERIDLDEAVELLTFGNSMISTYASNSLEAPDWIKETINALTKEISGRRRDNLQRALKSLKLRREGLKTVDQKRKDTDDEIARLEAALG